MKIILAVMGDAGSGHHALPLKQTKMPQQDTKVLTGINELRKLRAEVLIGSERQPYGTNSGSAIKRAARHRLERPGASKHPRDNTHNFGVRAVQEALILTQPAPCSPSLIDTRAAFQALQRHSGPERAACHDRRRMGLMVSGQSARLWMLTFAFQARA
ncbi:hypothetical protein E2C01_026643 [Portunus trituberculatus]|uniref:Uncharacterized protein n=1 Tax=Portunus trituberculatus TaxID=210409 RepID=A0A5B7EJG3_PORTR|nr:hypothetical protein [Portunus trituberculatus]